MADQHAVSEAGGDVHNRVCAALQTMLRGAQLRGMTDEALSAATLIPARTIKSYRVEGKEPSLGNALLLIGSLGPQAVNAILSTISYGGATPLEEVGKPDLQNMMANLLAPMAVIAAALSDGRIDHTEMPSCRDAADQIIATILPLSSAASSALKD